MRQILKDTWAIIKYNIGSLLLFETGYKIGTVFFVMQLVHKTVDFSLEKQHFSYLTAENYLKFLSSPLTFLFSFLLFLLLILLFFIEVFALFFAFTGSRQKRKVYAGDMLLEGVQRTFVFLRHGRGMGIFCGILSAPLLMSLFIAREVSYIKILEFTVNQIYKMVKPAYLLYLITGCLLLLSFLGVFLLPYCLLESEKGRTGIRREIENLRKHQKRNISGFLILHGIMILFIVLVYFLAMVLMTAFLMAVKSKSSVVSAVLIYSNYIHMWIGIFAGAVQMVMSLAFAYTVYGEHHGLSPQEILLYRVMSRYPWFSKEGQKRLAAALTIIILAAETGYMGVMAVNHDEVLDSLTDELKITAHRGGAVKAPENTISALKYTIDCGADYAEIDVQETKDKELILLHDDSFKRTAGVKKKVWEMTYPHVKKLDVGASFHQKFRGEKIPALDEVLNFCKGKLDLNIEIKYNGKNKGIVHRVVRAVREHGFEKHCVVTSMNYQFLQQIKKIAPEIRTGYIMTMTYGSISKVSAADFFSVKYTYVDEEFVQEAHACGKEVHAWTVNYKGDAKRMIDIGVDNIITDNPDMVRRVQNQESSSHTGFFELMKYALRI